MQDSYIAVVDDDPSVRQALQRLIKSLGYEAEVFPSAREFLTAPHFQEAACLILDIHMPGLGGWDLQSVLAALQVSIPTIFITARPDEYTQNRALAAGALGFLPKPFDDQSLIALIEKTPHLHHPPHSPHP
jgi:FixJ family two-component response regulator